VFLSKRAAVLIPTGPALALSARAPYERRWNDPHTGGQKNYGREKLSRWNREIAALETELAADTAPESDGRDNSVDESVGAVTISLTSGIV
jgi:hypothetical protein